MPPERAFSSVIQLFAVIGHVEAESDPDSQRIVPLNGNGQALAQEISLTYIPRDPRDQPIFFIILLTHTLFHFNFAF